MRKRLLARSLLCGFLLTWAAGWFPVAASCEALPRDVLRLHVVADSDSPRDQEVKLLVRDAVLETAAEWCAGAGTMEQASTALCLHLGAVLRAAEQTLAENGVSCGASVQMTEMYFPTRNYGEYSLPAGKYRTLRVTLGEGKGKNWWCVVFPSLCLPAARGEDVLALLPEGERKVVEQPGKYRVKLRVVELYQELKRYLEQW